MKQAWNFSNWGNRYKKNSGILQLMNDLGKINPREYIMLGGGTPAYIPEVNNYFNGEIKRLSKTLTYFNTFPFKYSPPQGNENFRSILANYFTNYFQTKVETKNITLTTGSQNSFYALFNFFSGEFNEAGGKKQKKKILFPLVPEYIGYEDVFFESDSIHTFKPKLKMEGEYFFSYEIDFNQIESIPHPEETIGAVAISIPCNPSGNVIRVDELNKLISFTKKKNLPLIIDNAYGLPFPGLIYANEEKFIPHWDENIIHTFSFSKIGLPGIRTGGVVAREEISEALSGYNAIANLSPPTAGLGILEKSLISGEINHLRDKFIQPFYREKREKALKIFHTLRGNLPIYLHQVKGSFFLWLWFKDMKISTLELYQKLKELKVIVIPGEYFFYTYKQTWKHGSECIRLHFGVDDNDLEKGLEKIINLVKKYI